MKKYLFSMVAVAAMLAMSAFTVAHHTSKMPPPGYFYKFIGDVSNHDPLDDPELWQRSTDDCDGSDNVCGVYLATDEGLGANPDTQEFEDVKDDILQSQQDHEAKSLVIIMKD